MRAISSSCRTFQSWVSHKWSLHLCRLW